MKDKYGQALLVGDTVIKASRQGSTVSLALRTVERIEGDRLYLDGSKGSYVTNYGLLVKVPAYFQGFQS